MKLLRQVLIAAVAWFGAAASVVVPIAAPVATSVPASAQVGQIVAALAPSPPQTCVPWTPADLAPAPRYILDPNALTYSGSNFASGTNTGSVGGAWTAEVGTLAKGAALNGLTTLNFTGSQSLINSTGAWPASADVFVFAVAKVATTQIGGLAAMSWGVGEGRTTTRDWVFYPRGGNSFGGSANEGWLFNGTSAAIITRGDLFTDTNYHIVTAQMGNSSQMSRDATSVTPTTSPGTIGASTGNNFRIGATGPSTAEPITALVAYEAILVDPSVTDVQKLIGWAAWRFGLVSQLDATSPYKSAPPCQSGFVCTTHPCPAAPLTWTQIQFQAGTATTRPLTNWGPGGPNYPGSSHTPCAQGIFAYQLPSTYSWACGGENWLGDDSRWGNNGSYLGTPHVAECNTNKSFDCFAMTEFHLVYVEATALDGQTAKATVTGTNVYYQNRSSYCHNASGGWFQAQLATSSDPIVTGRFDAPQSGNNATSLPVTYVGLNSQGNAVFYEQAPPFAPAPGWANHGWISSRGTYTLNQVDGCFTYMEVSVDQTGDNHIMACGQDWWQNAGANFPANTGYSQSSWIRVTVDWQSVVCSSLPLALLQADPPPPAVGIGP